MANFMPRPFYSQYAQEQLCRTQGRWDVVAKSKCLSLAGTEPLSPNRSNQISGLAVHNLVTKENKLFAAKP
jgi:hypothetical protein